MQKRSGGVPDSGITRDINNEAYGPGTRAKLFEPSTVLWAFHTIHPSSFIMYFLYDSYNNNNKKYVLWNMVSAP